MNKKEEKIRLALFLLMIILSLSFIIATPTGPSNIYHVSNSTKGATSAGFINISGGYISTINLTANSQNLRWKAFVGNVTGKFTLDDSGGSTIYDWTLSSTGGEVYATRNSGTITWTNISCATNTWLMQENGAMDHQNTSADSINNTFVSGTHSLFFVGATSITASSCPTLNTYVNSGSQDSSFEEIALYASSSVIYASILEEDVTGYDGQPYDFQMIVPENGDPGFTGATAYYLYVELS